MVEKHSKLWRQFRDELDKHDDYDFEADPKFKEARRLDLQYPEINVLRQAASALGLDVSGSKSDIIDRLVEADCFYGPVGDDTIYREHDGEAVVVMEEVSSAMGRDVEWKQRYEGKPVEDSDSEDFDPNYRCDCGVEIQDITTVGLLGGECPECGKTITEEDKITVQDSEEDSQEEN